MSKHQANRRRTYGRRQHELHERIERYTGALDWFAEADFAHKGERYTGPLTRRLYAAWQAGEVG